MRLAGTLSLSLILVHIHPHFLFWGFFQSPLSMSTQRRPARETKRERKKKEKKNMTRKKEKEAQRGKWEQRWRKPNFDFVKLFNETSCMKKNQKGEREREREGKKKQHVQSAPVKIDGEGD